MFEGERPTGTKAQIYRELSLMAEGLFEGERDAIANAANLAALLWLGLVDVNWTGFYFLRDKGLVLGPFQGKPACVRIVLGAGVCGTAAVTRKTVVIPDVAKFPGHIACDVASRSELVVPLIRGTKLIGVLDLDSPLVKRFDEADAKGIESLAAQWLAASEIGRASCRERVYVLV